MKKIQLFTATACAMLLIAGSAARAEDHSKQGLSTTGKLAATAAASGAFSVLSADGERHDRVSYEENASKLREMAPKRHILETQVTRLERAGGAASHTLAEKRLELETLEANEKKILREQAEIRKSQKSYGNIKKGTGAMALVTGLAAVAVIVKDKLTSNEGNPGAVTDSREKKADAPSPQVESETRTPSRYLLIEPAI